MGVLAWAGRGRSDWGGATNHERKGGGGGERERERERNGRGRERDGESCIETGRQRPRSLRVFSPTPGCSARRVARRHVGASES